MGGRSEDGAEAAMPVFALGNEGPVEAAPGPDEDAHPGELGERCDQVARNRLGAARGFVQRVEYDRQRPVERVDRGKQLFGRDLDLPAEREG
jgi:hypothetical protein